MDPKPSESDADKAGVKRSADEAKPEPPAKKPSTTSTTTQQLQQQIQQQLQQQLQAQLQAAAARGQQANITPEQIQAQAQAMVQAAAQAQAVVAAAKSRGDGLVPMNAAQIAALSQIQAQAIVHARKSQGTPAQIQTQIQLQAQALVHAHTQAQIQAGIYKGDTKEGESSGATTTPATTSSTAADSASSNAAATQQSKVAASTTTQSTSGLSSAQIQQQEDLKKQQAAEKQQKTAAGATPEELKALDEKHQQQLLDLQTSFRKQNGISVGMTNGVDGMDSGDGSPQPSATSPAFLAQLNGALSKFWQEAYDQIQKLENQTEQDFKNHNDLPLARIKRIMKSDEDVRMISAEAPVLFAKACELFILDLSIRSWNYSQLHKRRTLQKEDVREAIQKTDIFDFLVDVIQ